jgi:hypothetical protein
MDRDAYIKREYGSLVGRKIKTVRPLTNSECEDFGWDGSFSGVPMAIILDDGTALIPSSDPEGNDAGHIFVESTVKVPA